MDLPEMTLADLIKKRKQLDRNRGRGGKSSNRRGRRNTAGSMPGSVYSGDKADGAARRPLNGSNARPNPYFRKAKARKRHPSVYPVIGNVNREELQSLYRERESFPAGGATALRTRYNNGVPQSGFKASRIEYTVLISNLADGVSHDDISKFISKFGDVKRCSITRDAGRGTAEVVFSKTANGKSSSKLYNNVQLSGKPLSIALLEISTCGSGSFGENGSLGGSAGVVFEEDLAALLTKLSL